MDRISRGFRLLSVSWEVLKADRELMLLPIASFLATAAVAVTFFAAIWGAGLPSDGQRMGPGHYLLIAAFYFVAYSISIFFNAAIIGAATIRLQGGDPTLGDGLRVARERLGKILGWAALAASVGLLLRAFEERSGFLGRIVIAFVGAAWSALTFFVVPVLLFEELGVNESVKRSASLFKERWGEQFVGNVSIGLAMTIIAIPVGLVLFAVGSFAPWFAIPVGVIAFGGLIAAGSAMAGIFNAALYRFATTGEALGGFTPADLTGAFRDRRRRRLF